MSFWQFTTTRNTSIHSLPRRRRCKENVTKQKVKGHGGKRGYIVADALLLVMFLGWANERDKKHLFCGHATQTGKHLLRTQNVSDKNRKHFCVLDTNVARTGKRGNICVRNNVSSFATTLMSRRIAPHVRFEFWYISKPTLQNNNLKWE